MPQKPDAEGRLRTPLDELNRDLRMVEADLRTQFETRTVELLFQKFRLPGAAKAAIYQHRLADDGLRHLTLADFYAQYPTFPVRLSVRCYPKLSKQLRLSSLFLTFGSQPFVRDLEEILEESAQRIQGIVHPWPYIPQGMVLHNYPCESLHGGRFVYTREDGGEWFWEPLPRLLQGIRWQPGE